MAINTGKTIVAGFAAGVVANVVGYLLFGMWLGPRFEAETAAAAPTLAGKGMAGFAIGVRVATSFATGFLLAFLYAAMRPRFGPGMKTAVYGALVLMVAAFLFHMDVWIYGLVTPATYMLAGVAGFVQMLATAYVAGMLYKEQGGAV